MRFLVTSSLVLLCSLAFIGCGSDAAQPGNPQSSAGSSGSIAGGGGSGAAGNPASNLGGAPSTAGGGAGGAVSAGAGAPGVGGAAGASGAPSAAGAGGAAPTGVPYVYVGSTDDQISIYKLDAASGQLTFLKSVAGGDTPSFLAFDPTFAHLYAVNEGDAKVASFSIDPKTGDLKLLNRVSSGGDGPAHVAVDRSGKYVMVANYTGGTTRVFPIAADGSLGTPSDNKSTGKNAHMITTDPANKFAFVANLGSNTVSQFSFDASNGTMSANSVPTVAAAAGAGPRHFAFHPSAKFAYVINETNDTMAAYSYDATLGRMSFLQVLSTLPDGSNGASNNCAEIVVAPSGNFVYGSNRGHDSIVTFSVDAATGKLTFVGTTPSGGDTPRSFAISADGKSLLVANESGNVTSFAVDVASGALTKLKTQDVAPKPQFVGIALLPVVLQ